VVPLLGLPRGNAQRRRYRRGIRFRRPSTCKGDTNIVDFTLGLYGYDFTPKPAAQAVRQLVDTWRMQG
jgi:hypothetical protein